MRWGTLYAFRDGLIWQADNYYTREEALAAMGLDEFPDTEELRLEQEQKADEEQEAAKDAATDEDTATHRRRAEKAGYLQEKLEERRESEREAD